jgi:hypothetical protein
MAARNAITVGVDVFKGVFVKAHGRPAEIVAYGAVAAIAAAGAALGYGTYQGAQYLLRRVRGRGATPNA